MFGSGRDRPMEDEEEDDAEGSAAEVSVDLSSEGMPQHGYLSLR